MATLHKGDNDIIIIIIIIPYKLGIQTIQAGVCVCVK